MPFFPVYHTSQYNMKLSKNTLKQFREFQATMHSSVKNESVSHFTLQAFSHSPIPCGALLVAILFSTVRPMANGLRDTSLLMEIHFHSCVFRSLVVCMIHPSKPKV